MNIGDKVRFLNAVGGGRITGFQGKDLVLVTDEDGFEVPTLRHEIVVVDTDVEEDRLARVSVSGDFFLDPDDALTRITASLEGAPASSSAKDLAARVEAALHEGDTLMGVTPEAVGIAVRRRWVPPCRGTTSTSTSSTAPSSTR